MDKTRIKKVIMSVGLLVIIAILLTTSYAYYQKTKPQDNMNVAMTNCLDLSLSGNTAINLEKVIPISDEDGMQLTPYTFTITNTCKTPIQYDVNLESLVGTTFENTSLKVAIDNTSKLYSEYEEAQKTIDDAKESRRLTSGVLKEKDNSVTYDLRIWIDADAPITEQGKVFESKIVITGSLAQKGENGSGGNNTGGGSSGSGNGGNGESGSGTGSEVEEPEYAYTEAILNGADPVLKGSLVPITLNDDGTVRKANINREWYRYSNQEWANAVILRDSYTELGNTGSLNGNPVKEEESLILDGVDDWINLGHNSYNFENTITIAARVKFNEIKEQKIISNDKVSLKMNGDHKIVFEIVGTSNTVYQAIAATDINTNKIYSIVGTYDGENMRLYINGDLLYTKANTENIQTTGNYFYVGKGISEYIYAGMKVYETLIVDNYENTEEVERYYSGAFKLNAKNIVSYQRFDGRDYEISEVIAEDSIESYFVWIPKYAYQIFDLGNYTATFSGTSPNNAQEIQIKFGLTNTSDSNEGECTNSQISGGGENCQVGDWMTHPAFTSFDVNGLWVAKYVASNSVSKMNVKPNKSAYSPVYIKDSFEAGFNYNRSLDSHMVKNTEWGAIAYLSHSKYGINNVVKINNGSSGLLTGYNYDSDNNAQPYNTSLGCAGTTTGNITGIYDMGGAFGQITAAYRSTSGTNNGFTEDPATTYGSVYFDVYSTGSAFNNYTYRILGDATGELGPFIYFINSWYGMRQGRFIQPNYPWFARAYPGTNIFYFDGNGSSGGHYVIELRIVLAVK